MRFLQNDTGINFLYHPSRRKIYGARFRQVLSNTGDYELTYVTDGGPVDMDDDGIPNSWESDNGLNPKNPDDALEDVEGGCVQ